jgi:hypothetical protein
MLISLVPELIYILPAVNLFPPAFSLQPRQHLILFVFIMIVILMGEIESQCSCYLYFYDGKES